MTASSDFSLILKQRTPAGQAEYAKTLRSAVRGLWTGSINLFDFADTFTIAIQTAYRRAWLDGASECGLREADLSEEERTRLDDEIISEQQYVFRFAQDIMDNSQSEGKKLAPHISRTALWAQGYTRIKELAKTMACADRKLRWTLHPAEHCNSCLKLDGKVKRASFWKNANLAPKSWTMLDCKLGCKCSLDPTDAPITPGPLPSLP